MYLIFFTCDVCKAKNARTFTKKAYHEGKGEIRIGVVIIKCPSC